MIARFLRRPAGAAEWAADALRAVGVLGVVVAGFGWSLTDAGILALALPALALPRFLGVHAGFDLVYSVTVLVAVWSNVLGLYRTVAGWDLVVHFACTGVIALMLYLFAGRLGIVGDPLGSRLPVRVPLTVVPLIGLAISAVWEMMEWIGYTFVSDDIFVTYVDTIGDMAAGGLGAVVAGVVAARRRMVE